MAALLLAVFRRPYRFWRRPLSALSRRPWRGGRNIGRIAGRKPAGDETRGLRGRRGREARKLPTAMIGIVRRPQPLAVTALEHGLHHRVLPAEETAASARKANAGTARVPGRGPRAVRGGGRAAEAALAD